MTVLPGLIDCHTHLADGHGDERRSALAIKEDSFCGRARICCKCEDFLYEGFTSVRDVGVYRALNDIAPA